ncbi:MAG: serine protease [Hyphomicrobiales bacterium]
MSAARIDLAAAAGALEAAAGSGNGRATESAARRFVGALRASPGPIDPPAARRVLAALRSAGRYRQLRLIARAIIDDGCDDPQVYRQYAEAVTHVGRPAEPDAAKRRRVAAPEPGARTLARKTARRRDPDGSFEPGQLNEIFAPSLPHDDLSTRFDLPEPSGADIDLPDEAPATADAESAGRPDWLLAVEPEVREKAVRAAQATLDRVDARAPLEQSPGDAAEAGEALLLIGDTEAAIARYRQLTTHAALDAPMLGATVGDLADIWRLGETETGNALIAPMKARLLDLPGGQISASPPELKRMAAVEPSAYEKVLGPTGPKTHQWIMQGLRAARSVALIRQNGRGIGTGFVVRGGDLKDDFGDELLVLTNAHVVSDPPDEDAATPDEASVTFELLSDEGEDAGPHAVAGVLWQSPRAQHDAALLRLDPPVPAALAPLTLAPRLPLLSAEEPQRVYIIGHPGGGELSYSFEDNELLDYETALIEAEDDARPCRIHYRTPTERGNSGSPVFNANWRAIGLHHAGKSDMQRLNGKPGTYPANEGIWLISIKRALNAPSV